MRVSLFLVATRLERVDSLVGTRFELVYAATRIQQVENLLPQGRKVFF
jgi:hypothetical protein